MKSYKNWKLINESLFPLGLTHHQNLGFISNDPAFSEAKKKMKGKMQDEDMDIDNDEGDDDDDEEHTCSCNKNMKKKMKGEDGKSSKQTPKDHSSEKSWSKEKKKKMDDMENPMMMKKKKPVVDDEEDDDEENVEDDHIEDDDDVAPDESDEESDDVEGNDDEEGDEEEMGKYGFMKKKMKKMKKKMKKMQEEAAKFEEDIASYPDAPVNHAQDSDKEFFASLKRQFGKPGERFSSGLSEDLLIPLTDPNAPAFVSQPTPGEVGYAPVDRIGGALGSYAENAELSILSKYLGTDAAKKLVNKK